MQDFLDVWKTRVHNVAAVASWKRIYVQIVGHVDICVLDIHFGLDLVLAIVCKEASVEHN